MISTQRSYADDEGAAAGSTTRRGALLLAASAVTSAVVAQLARPVGALGAAFVSTHDDAAVVEAFVAAVASSPLFAGLPVRGAEDIAASFDAGGDLGAACVLAIAPTPDARAIFMTSDQAQQLSSIRSVYTDAARDCTPAERINAFRVDALVQAVGGALLPAGYPFSFTTNQI